MKTYKHISLKTSGHCLVWLQLNNTTLKLWIISQESSKVLNFNYSYACSTIMPYTRPYKYIYTHIHLANLEFVHPFKSVSLTSLATDMG